MNTWRSVLVVFGLSLAVYAVGVSLFAREVFVPTMQWEAPAVAITLATQGTFGDPYALPTGPTAHLPPVAPAINALVYRAFGVTAAAGYVSWMLDGIWWALVWGLLPWLAVRLGFDVRAGVYAGVAGAVIPSWPGHGENLAALSLILILAAFVSRWSVTDRLGDGAANGSRHAGWSPFLLGMGCGVAFHVQPALLLVVLGLLVAELLLVPSRRTIVRATITVLGIVVACAPWAWRNYRTFDAVFFVRSNFGLELRMGNHPGADAAMEVMDRRDPHLHPRALESEAQKVRDLGEVAYMRAAGREAVDWMRAHPAETARLTASRAAQWWLGPFYQPWQALVTSLLTLAALAGLALSWPRLTVRLRVLLVVPWLTFPLVYYVVAYMPRYRQPIDWLFYLLAATAACELRRRWADARSR